MCRAMAIRTVVIEFETCRRAECLPRSRVSNAPHAVAEESHNVVQYSTMDAGDHFPFYEAPDALIDEIQTFSLLL